MLRADQTARKATQRPTIRDVASLAGVSAGTVSNVLNRPDLVKKAKRERVETAMRELGFVRNRSARQLRMGRSQTVGLLILDISGPYPTAVARGVENRLADDGFMLMLCSSGGQPERERRQLLQLEEQSVGGVLVGPSSSDLSALDEIRSRGTAAVLLDRASPDGEHCSVVINDVKGAEMAAKHLLEMGHRRICFVSGPRRMQQSRDRRAGLHQAVRDAGLNVESTVSEIAVPTIVPSAGEDVVARILAEPEPPTAIMCINDRVALGVSRGLHARGVKIPEDVAVVGYDDLEFAAMLTPPLTSVRRPKDEFGRMAAELLLDEIENPDGHIHQQVVFQTELVIRESSDFAL